ncbi:oxidoreductase [Mycobacteroides sp. H001]|uniref:carboxylic acid reductase n=1 Tax=unclassified Mycobacteroides TaxID=2618759 RepID=UPI000713BDDF|nr:MULTISPECIES: carboxylic acid reductase [unclassified Mycobacteroides]KRQ20423.1 oxidoreductase [Mycobacteroides sp. H072]KRQ34232.1 oxidoreductase [Mycobacteroides sp. H002]KRQ52051.1 oxidoreductase [Mycobacteroides sp. H054]KRQ71324.1 oxidoreductase [Mycobacteroides sp. H001]
MATHKNAGGVDTSSGRATLQTNDAQHRDAEPRRSVVDAARTPGLRLPSVLETLTAGYADRPALGRRSTTVLPNAETGRAERRLLPEFETVTYGELWADVQAIAAAFTADDIRAGDFVATIGFASADYLTVDIVSGYLGLVAIPLQHNSPLARLVPILAEAQPRVLTVSANYLDLAAAAVQRTPSVRNLIVFDFDAEIDDHREALQRARVRLTGEAVTIETLTDVTERGRALPIPPAYDGGSDDRLAMILYTSGSTGAPKGAMWTERMVTTLWTTEFISDTDLPVINVNFMPLNHLGGRIPLSASFQTGGTSYFVPESDLSTLFEDLSLVRPTQLALVPRVVDMLFQRHQTRVDRLVADGLGHAEADVMAKTEIRGEVLGGRILGGFTSTAPLAADMKAFVESTLDIHLVDAYGLTELGGVMRDGVIGRPPVIDYKLVDVPELGYFTTDRPHPRGELLVKTATATPGYYKRPEITAEVFDADGYYRTGDVMAEVAPDHLVYVDRRNNVLKLAQGEFVAIANLEAVFAGAALVRQIFVYGNSERSSLLAVIVPTDDALTRFAGDGDGLRSALRGALQSTARAAELQPYEVPADFFVETEPFTTDNGLLSGVGKLLRPNLKAQYGERLEQLYSDIAEARTDDLRALREAAADQPVVDTVVRAAQALLGLPGAAPSPDVHFIDLGGDSLSALTFSNLLTEVFGVDVPVGVIIGPSTDLAALAAYVESERSSEGSRPTAVNVHGAGATEIAASELTLDRFIDQATLAAAADLPTVTADPTTVLLTGANGYLGRFLTLEWLQRMAKTGGRLVALVRGDGPEAAYRRLEKAFDTGDDALLSEFRSLAADHLEVLPGDIGEPNFGLDEGTWTGLSERVDAIVHPAALVNHLLPYGQLFGPNVVGTAEVIRLAISSRIKPVTYLSTVAVAMGVSEFVEDGDIREVSPRRPIGDGYANGYANSKWAGEVLLREAHDLCDLPVSVFRSDMILAHSRFAGQLNVPDAFTRLLISLLTTGIAPSSFYAGDEAGQRPRAHYDGLPADFVAEAITTIGADHREGFTSYDVMNPHDDGVSLDVIVDWLIDDGAAIRRIDGHAEWVARFEAALRGLPEPQRSRSALALLDAYRIPETPLRGAIAPTAVFRAAVQAMEIGAEQDIPHIDAALIGKYVTDLRALDLV